MDLPQYPTFPYHDVAFKVALSAGIGMLVGFEREWAQKEIGVRTFAIAALLGMLTSLLSQSFVLGALGAVTVLAAFLNVQSLLKDKSLEITTSMCLFGIVLLGALVGQEQYFSAATSAIVIVALLAWKPELAKFADALRPEEIRSAVLLGLLGVVIFPLLPDHFVDKWQLLNPRQAWVTVLIIAGIGFVNYVLLRLYSSRGMYYAATLGGLVNSTAAVAELASILRKQPDSPLAEGVAVLLLTNVAMFMRNIVILAIFAPHAVESALLPLASMTVVTVAILYFGRSRDDNVPARPLHLTSPVSLFKVMKFAVVFIALAAAGTLAQRHYGDLGFLIVAVCGGLVSSASTTATAASLAVGGHISLETAGIATILTSMSSALVNLPLVYQETRQLSLTRRLAMTTALILVAGIVAMVARWAHMRNFGYPTM